MGKSTKKKQKAKRKAEEKKEPKSNKRKNQREHRQDFIKKRKNQDTGTGNNTGIALSGNQKCEASMQGQALQASKTAAVLAKEKCSYVGLVNQGATCYLNTLLQTFFMTPEFKKIICRLPAEKKMSSSICYQLQKLFKELEEHHGYAVTTDGIIMSLGLNRQDVLEQQDLEEYFRLILNKAATELDGSDILQLFQSKVTHSLMCLKCHTESPRESLLLDIPLPIQPLGCSVEKSFEEFLKAEILNGSNMCYCDKCKVKTETKSRYYFEQLPKILTLHLKRFTYDAYGMNYIKLNTSIDIPATLTFLKRNKNQNAGKAEWCLSPVAAQSTVAYELFAICDHLGGYGVGHYVSRIKSYTNKWYCFNDSKVTENNLFGPSFTRYSINEPILNGIRKISSDFTKKETDNASNGFHVSVQKCNVSNIYSFMKLHISVHSSSTAYMLMYRRKDENTNSKCGERENKKPAEQVKHMSEDKKIEDGEGKAKGKEGEEEKSRDLTERTALQSNRSNMKTMVNATVDKEHSNLDNSTTIMETEKLFQAGEQKKGKLKQSNPKEMEKARKSVKENRTKIGKIGKNTVKPEGNAEELIVCEVTAVATSDEPRGEGKGDDISGGNDQMVEEDLRMRNQEEMMVGSKTLKREACSKRGMLCCSFIVIFCITLFSWPFHPYLLSLQMPLVTSNLSSARKVQRSGLEPCPSRLPIPLHLQPVEGQDGKKDSTSTQVETHHWNESLSCGDQPCCPARD